VPEFSRRARGFAVYAALRSLGRTGLAELVDRTCGCARQTGEDEIDLALDSFRRAPQQAGEVSRR
jgi:glutamate/tyrosine decarboxylase-like PLP-dependent enzyme